LRIESYLPATFGESTVPLEITACDIYQGLRVDFDTGDRRAAFEEFDARIGL
jgi:hypothetical protein